MNGVPFFFVIPRGDSGRAMEQALAATNIPMWSGSFAFQGITYTFVMIGTNPASGSATTSVPVVIIPLKFNFTRGVSLSPETTVCNDTETALQRTQNSPILKSVSFYRAEQMSGPRSTSMLFSGPTSGVPFPLPPRTTTCC